MQYPHCAASSSRNAAWTGWRPAGVPIPSSVVISLPTNASTAVAHDVTASTSTRRSAPLTRRTSGRDTGASVGGTRVSAHPARGAGTMPRVRARGVGALVALAAAVVLGTAGGVRADPPVPLDGTDGPPPADAAQPAPPPQATTAAVTTTSAAPADGAPSTTTAPAAVAVASSPGCAPIGAVAILRPHQRPLVLSSAGGGLAYPADGSVLTA